MQFAWDPAKAAANLRKHGISFEDAFRVFDGPYFSIRDTRADYGEERFAVFGFLDSVPVVIVYGENEGDVIRIISMRKATPTKLVKSGKPLATDIEALRAKRAADIDLSDVPEFEPRFLDQATFHPGDSSNPLVLVPDDEIAAWLAERGPDAQEEVLEILREHIRKQRGAA